MQRLMAMVWLTVKAALRSRLIWVLTAMLIGGVVVHVKGHDRVVAAEAGHAVAPTTWQLPNTVLIRR